MVSLALIFFPDDLDTMQEMITSDRFHGFTQLYRSTSIILCNMETWCYICTINITEEKLEILSHVSARAKQSSSGTSDAWQYNGSGLFGFDSRIHHRAFFSIGGCTYSDDWRGLGVQALLWCSRPGNYVGLLRIQVSCNKSCRSAVRSYRG